MIFLILIFLIFLKIESKEFKFFLCMMTISLHFFYKMGGKSLL